MERKRSRSRGLSRGATRYGVLGFLVVMSALDGACGRTDVWYRDDAYGAQGGNNHLIGGSGGRAGKGGSGGKGGTGGTGTGAVGTGGTGTIGAGGTIMVGTGGTSGGRPGRGGAAFGGRGPGGRPGTGGVGTAGTAGAGATGPFACSGTLPTCDRFTNFALEGDITWGNGAFTGGIAVFGDGLIREYDTTTLHVSGLVEDYGHGFVIWFTTCSDLRNTKGITFTLSGATGYTSQLQFSPQPNSDYPWQSAPQNGKGACTASDPTNPWAECVLPYQSVTLSPMSQSAYWFNVVGGVPVPWNANTSPGELIGLQWLFPYDPNVGPYYVDVTLDDVAFIDGNTTGVDCGPFGGTGGAGGMSGAAGFGGFGFGGFGGVLVGGAPSSGGVSFGGGGNVAGFAGLAGASGLGGAGGFTNSGGAGSGNGGSSGFSGNVPAGGLGGLGGLAGASGTGPAAGAAGT